MENGWLVMAKYTAICEEDNSGGTLQLFGFVILWDAICNKNRVLFRLQISLISTQNNSLFFTNGIP